MFYLCDLYLTVHSDVQHEHSMSFNSKTMGVISEAGCANSYGHLMLHMAFSGVRVGQT